MLAQHIIFFVTTSERVRLHDGRGIQNPTKKKRARNLSRSLRQAFALFCFFVQIFIVGRICFFIPILSFFQHGFSPPSSFERKLEWGQLALSFLEAESSLKMRIYGACVIR
jgi:hypothetical protein